MATDPEVQALLRKYGLAAEEPAEPSLWDTVTQPVKTLFGFTGGLIPQVFLGGTDLYKEAAQKELEALAASKGVGVEALSPSERTQALPGLGRVLTEADVFENSTPGRIAAMPLRLLGDIVGDPTSYLGGAGALTKLRAVKQIAAGAHAGDVLKAARLVGTGAEGVSGLDRATRAGKFVAEAGEALKEGKRFKAAANLLGATVPQAPFGVLPAVAYAPEAYRGVSGSLQQASEAFSQGEYGTAAEAAAGGLGAGLVYGLLARGAYSELAGKEAGRFAGELAEAAERRAGAAAAEASTPPLTGAEAAAKYAQGFPDLSEAYPNPEPFQAPTPPPPGYPSVADGNLNPYMVGAQYPNPAGDTQVVTPLAPKAPRGSPNPERAPKLRSANQPVAGAPETVGQNPLMAPAVGTADQKLGDNPQAPPAAVVPPPTMPSPQPTLAPEPPLIARLTREKAAEAAALDDRDELFDEAVRFVVQSGQASTSMLQRRFRIGFSRAGRLIDMLERDGIIGPADAGLAPVIPPQAPTASTVAPTASSAADQIAALASSADTEEKAWEVIRTVRTLGAKDEDIIVGFKAAGFTDDDLGSLFARPVVEPGVSPGKGEITPEVPLVKGETPSKPVQDTGTPVQVPRVEAAPAKPAPAPNEKKVAAVTTVLGNVLDPNTPAQKISEDALSKHLGGSAAKKTAKAVNELLDNLTDLQKLPGKKFTRTLKPEVNAPETLAAMKALHPTQVDALDAVYARVTQPKVEAPKVEAPPVEPPKINPEALRASILEGVDLAGNPNAPALLAARRKLGGLSKEEKQALAGLYPDKPVDLSKPPSVVAQSLARRLGLTQEKESFRADGTVKREAVAEQAKPAVKAPVAIESPKVERTPPEPPAVATTRPTDSLQLEAQEGAPQYISRLEAQIARKEAELARMPEGELGSSLERAREEFSKSIEANRTWVGNVKGAAGMFPDKPLGEALDEFREWRQTQRTPSVGEPEPLPEGAQVLETVSPRAEENRRVGELHSKNQALRNELDVAEAAGDTEKATQLKGELEEVEQGLSTTYPRLKLLDSIDRDDPKQVELANKIIEVSQSRKFANLAQRYGIDLASISPEAMTSFYKTIFRQLLEGDALSRGEDGVLTGMLNVVGRSRLQDILRREKLLTAKKDEALQILMDVSGMKRIPRGVDETGARRPDELTTGSDEVSKRIAAEKEQAVSEMEAGGEKAILQEVQLGDPTGEARLHLVKNVADRVGVSDEMIAAMGSLREQLDQLQKQTFKGGSKESGLAKVAAFLTEHKIEEDPAKYLRKVLTARESLQSAISQEIAGRTHRRYDGSVQADTAIRTRVEDLKKLVAEIEKSGVESIEPGDLWRLVTKLNADILGMQEYLRDRGASKTITDRLERLGVYSKTDPDTALQQLFRVTATVVGKSPGDDTAKLTARINALRWLPGKGYRDLNTYLRRNLEEILGGVTPDEAKELWKAYSSLEDKATHVARELNPKLRKDPLAGFGKRMGEPVKTQGGYRRLYQDKPENPGARLMVSVDTETRQGAGVRLPAAGIPRIEGVTSKSGAALNGLVRNFLLDLKDTGGSALKRGDQVENALVFTVDSEIPSSLVRALKDPETLRETGYHVEEMPRLDTYMDDEPTRVGYQLVSGEAEIPEPMVAPKLEGVRANRGDAYRMRQALKTETGVESPAIIPGSPAETIEPRPLGLSEAEFSKFHPGMTPEEIAQQMALGKKSLVPSRGALSQANYPDPSEYMPRPAKGGGRASSPRPTEGVPHYRAQQVGESVAEWNRFLNEGTTPAIARATIEQAFPGMPVTDTHYGWEVRIPNGNSIFVHKTGWIAINEAALKEGYGPGAKASEYVAEGEFKTLGPDGLIRIVKGEALPEEVGHAMFSMALTHNQRKNLLDHYGDEESAIKGWNEWRGTYKREADPTGFFGMVKRFFTNLYRRFKPTVDHTFKQMESGEIWKQKAQPIEAGPRYSAVPKETEEFAAKEPTAEDYQAAIDALSKASPKSPSFKIPTNLDANKVMDAFMEFETLTKDIPDLPTKPGGGKGILDLGFNSFRNKLSPEVMRHAVLVNGLMKKLKQGDRYASRPELQVVIDSLAKKIGTIDPVEMTNRVNAIVGKEMVSHEVEQGLRYIQQLNNTFLEANQQLTDKVLDARAVLDRLTDTQGERRAGVGEAQYKAALQTYSDALDVRAAQGLAATVIGNADAGAGMLLGRLLRARALNRDALNPADMLRGRLYTQLYELTKSKELASLALDKFMKEGDPSQIIAIAEAARKPTWFAKFMEFIKAGMLGPSSWAASALGNAGMFQIGKIEDAVATRLVSPLIERIGKKYGKSEEWAKARTMAPVPFRLIQHAGRIGGAQATSGAAGDLRSIFGLRKLDIRPQEITDIAEFPHRLGAIGGTKGEFIRTPYKIQSAVDYYFQSKIRAREAMVEAWNKAVHEGTPAEGLESTALKHFETIMNGYDMTHPEWRTSLNQPWVKDAIERIDHELTRKTFQRSLHGTPFEYVERMVRKYPGLQLLIPFVRTPANVFLETLRRTPLGVFMSGTGEKGALTARDLAKPVVGTSLMALFYSMAEDGDIVTGGGDIDPERREVQKQTGWLPYSVRIGDKWVTYNRFEPISSIIGIAADMAEAVRRGDAHDVGSLLERGIQITQNNLTNKTFLSGLSNFMTAYSDPERYGERLAKGLTGMLVPNVIGGIPFGTLSRAMDPTFRQTDVLTEPLAKIPGVSKQFPAQATVMGEERQRPGSFLSRLAFPGQISEVKHDKPAEVAKFLDKIDAKNRAPRRTERVYGAIVEYTPEEFELLKKAHRDATSEVYARAKGGAFNGYPDNEDDPRYVPGMRTKQDLVNDIFKKHRGRAKAIITPRLEKRARGLLKQRHQEARGDA